MNYCRSIFITVIPFFIFVFNVDIFAEDTASTLDKMQTWSRQLGVTCNYCHDQNNFLSQKKIAYKISQKHGEMVKILAKDIFNERDKGGNLFVEVNCYMCHQGKAHPNYKEPSSFLNFKKKSTFTNEKSSEDSDDELNKVPTPEPTNEPNEPKKK